MTFSCLPGKYVPPKDTFQTFESRYEATAFSPKDLAKTLDAFSDFYEIISGQKPDRSETVSRALDSLNALDSSTTYPLLLMLFDRRAYGTITDDQLGKAIDMLCGFIMRRFICNESSRGYGQMFVRALADDKRSPFRHLNSFCSTVAGQTITNSRRRSLNSHFTSVGTPSMCWKRSSEIGVTKNELT